MPKGVNQIDESLKFYRVVQNKFCFYTKNWVIMFQNVLIVTLTVYHNWSYKDEHNDSDNENDNG